MRSGIIAKKVGMTRLFFEDGRGSEDEFVFDNGSPVGGLFDPQHLMHMTKPNAPEPEPMGDIQYAPDTSTEMFVNTQMVGLDLGFPDIG